ncbi:hypothetical protein [Bacillus sp. FJAT-52991]|uniref:Uncharacterized protein n=1 Tax=Bacillus kandeliae TaxID=3129297 RepID=A0ABZ2N2H3_9BACI
MLPEVAYYPPKELEELLKNGIYGFHIKGHLPFSFDIETDVLKHGNGQWLLKLMESQNMSPIYILLRISFGQKEFLDKCLEVAAHYEIVRVNKTNTVITITAKNMDTFAALLPNLITFGCALDTVLWSNYPWVFSEVSIENQDKNVLLVEVKAEAIIYWVGYDGNWIGILTGNSNYSSYEKVISRLSPAIKVEVFEREDIDFE